MAPGRGDPVEPRSRVRLDATGGLVLGDRAVIPAGEIAVRTTTSGGPGGQHANRSLTKVVVSWRVADSSLDAAARARVEARLGPVVRASASRFRSRAQNHEAALVQLGERLLAALTPRTPRRATRPTRASVERRLEDKRARARTKSARRGPEPGA
ncbi:MAG TPA: peptide chain release factor-like protein [Acidimicrobiales bacterium]|nr:peptide chain release factor-like protein [Acidimicrobiales bacterium]